jgi:hypothetical protein
MIYYILFITLFLGIPFVHGLSNQQNTSETKPDINVEGKFGGSNIYNITINKLYKKIPVYDIPPIEGDDPLNIISYIDLVPVSNKSSVQSIELMKNQKDEETYYQFKNKSYLKVKVKFQGDPHTKGASFSRIYLMNENTLIQFNQEPGGTLVELKLLGLHEPLYIESFEQQKN